MAAIRQGGQWIMVRKVTDMLLCLPARTQIANSDDMMGPSGKIE
jgi:hypothetical protein